MLVKRGDFAVYSHGKKGDEWVCTNAQIWRSSKHDIDVICDKSEIFNLASIPFWARWAIPVNGRSRNAAAMHDPAYAKHIGYRAGTVSWDEDTGEIDLSNAEEMKISRELADDMILEACLDFQVHPMIARIIQFAVKFGGYDSYWDSYVEGGTWLPDKHRELYLTNAKWPEPN